MRSTHGRSISIGALAVAALAIAGCGSTRTQSDRIVLGSGGGYTGAYSGYIIHGDGKVAGWRGVGAARDSVRPLFTLSRDSTDRYFDQLESMKFTTIDFNSPGNFTYLLELEHGDSSHIVRWGDARYAPPTSVSDFYAQTIEMILNRTAR
jgi:hypothetical protein